MNGPVAVGPPGQLAECPIWDGKRQRVVWVDIRERTVLEYRVEAGSVTSKQFPIPVTAIALSQSGGFIVAAGRGFGTLDGVDGSLALTASVDRGDRMNDGKCDPAGRFLAGTLVRDTRHGEAALYRMESTGVSMLLDNVTLSNGLGWSPDGGTFYYIDTVEERVDAFDYDVVSGAIGRRRVFVDLGSVPGRPDGLAVDREGGVWVAMARGGAAVRRFTVKGKLDLVLEMPTSNVTSVAFGGDDLCDLYITTSKGRLTEEELQEQPLAGCLFCAHNVGVHGLAPGTYQG